VVRSKEIIVLLVLFVAMVAGTTWYVIDRRAKNRRAAPPATATTPTAATPAAPGPLIERTPPEPIALGTKETERKTIDFSSGQAVVKDTAEDQAALEAGLKEIAEATQGVTFEAERPTEAPKK
jgi:hypothetical protein